MYSGILIYTAIVIRSGKSTHWMCCLAASRSDSVKTGNTRGSTFGSVSSVSWAQSNVTLAASNNAARSKTYDGKQEENTSV